MEAFRGGCGADREDTQVLALRPEQARTLTAERRKSGGNELQVIQEWRNDLGEARMRLSRPPLDAKYQLKPDYQFPAMLNAPEKVQYSVSEEMKC